MSGQFARNVLFVRERVKSAPDSTTLSIATLATRTLPAVLRVQAGEKVLLITDVPKDLPLLDRTRELRLQMLGRWKRAFEQMGVQSSDVLVYEDTGSHGASLPREGVLLKDSAEPTDVVVADALASAHLLIAMTEFSATGPLKMSIGTERRAVSMPGVELEMEPAMAADYSEIASTICRLLPSLEEFNLFDVEFRTAADTYYLFVDVRGSKFHGDDGACHTPGTIINLPSGEIYIAPFEGDGVISSLTRGRIPVFLSDGTMVVLHVGANQIRPDSVLDAALREVLTRKPGNRNVAEFAFGLNPRTRTHHSTPILELEKTLGIHWAYGMSAHLGGTVGEDTTDVHEDIVYPVADARCRIRVFGYSKHAPETRVLIRDADGNFSI